AEKYTVGDNVKGTVTRVTPFGVFVRLDSDIDGLVHISEISNERIEDPGTILHLGEKFDFKIISIDPDAHRLGLSFKRANEPETVVTDTEEKPEKKTRAKKTRKKLSEEVAESDNATEDTPSEDPKEVTDDTTEDKKSEPEEVVSEPAETDSKKT